MGVSEPGSKVALRKESVDRNAETMLYGSYKAVALRKESVDRNPGVLGWLAGRPKSLSARRAWIEIAGFCWVSLGFVGRSPQGERG